MPVMDAKFSNFADGGDLQFDDQVVGLRDGVNTRFSYQGAPGVYLPLAGGTMQGAIDMDTNSITGLPTPSFSSDAATKAYVDALTAPVGAAGTFQRSNGTAWLASSSTIPDTFALGDIIYASATNVLTALSGNTTAVKQYLSQTGTGSAAQAPAWATVSGGDITGAALTKTDDTNVTMTLGGTPATALLRAASMTLGWTGQLAVGRGGSGAATLTGLLTGNGTSAFTGTAITQYNVLTGGASNVPNSVSPSATSGIPLISQGSSAQPIFGTAVVSGGGTGNTTFTAYSLICAGTTATGAFQNVSGVGTANQVLVSNGAAALPSWQSVPGLSPAAMTKSDDTNVTLTLGGTPSTSLLQAVSLTLGWTGQLGLTRGGTNASLTAVNGGIVYSNAAALAISAAGSSGQLLQSAGATTPVWTTASYPGTAGTSGNFMQSNGTNWTSASPAALSKTDDTNVTMTLGGSPTVALMAAASMTLGWTGQLSVPRGGTGLGSATAYAVLCGGTTSTGAFQSVVSVGSTGQVLTSNGAAALPTFQNATGTGTVNSGTTGQLAYYASNGTTLSGGQVGNILGTATNDSASTGYCGEFVSSIIGSGSAVSLTNAANANITSLSLTAGDWDVWGNAAFVNGTGVISYAEGWLSSTSATGVDASLFVQDVAWGASNNNGFSVPSRRFSLSGSATIYLSVNSGFTGNLSACGGAYARRRR